jgi:hypothetical protein
MSDKALLFLIGLTVGVASFAAVGAATSVIFTEVQGRMATQTQPPLTSYAQYQRMNDPVAR